MFKNRTSCQNISSDNVVVSIGIVPSVEIWEALLMIFGFGLFACLLAYGFTQVRKKVYHDKDNLDIAFDAGGKVSIGLTASTIVSQWTWAATLLQSSTVASKYGISGSFWYAAGATIQILLFAMLSVQLKIRAPGAKTFLQVIKARFGLKTHSVFCVFALLTNIIVTAMLMLGGAAVLTSLVRGLSVEYATALVMTVIGAYTLIGGLGATFYVSYFNTAIIYIAMLIFMMAVYHNAENPNNPLGSIDKVYNLVSCSEGPASNQERSFLTILSNSGLIFGMINIVGNFGTVFVDQSYWQSSVAAKPKEGVWGFLSGGIAWFAVPFSLATTMGLAYIALSTRQGSPLLTADQVDSGLVPCVVAQQLLGKQGELLMMFMILMAITSTGAAEVVAVTSILVYDIYQIHLRPYRHVTDANGCILCGKARGRMANPRDKCECVSMTYCGDCASDDNTREICKRAVKPDFRCKVHGPYRLYAVYLGRLKSWGLLWSTLAIFPLTMILNMMQLSLGWVYLFMGVLIGSAVMPITLAMFWGRMNSYGMMSGAIGGSVCSLSTWLIMASTLDGGLSLFLVNTGNEIPMLYGNLVAILSGGFISIVVSLITNRNYIPEAESEIWESTRDIDNPLSPWTEMYARELNLTGVQKIDNRPSLSEVHKTFRVARLVATAGAISLTVILVIIWPLILVALQVMDRQTFTGWVNLTEVFGFLATLFIVIMPLVSEGLEIRRALNEIKPMPSVSRPKSSVPREQPITVQSEVPEASKTKHTELTTSSVQLEADTTQS
ncbi:uncharacterized protein LOC135465474 [Liolophura sinensis]|uniref:uncharacterized protein LOC135465474 n=1 Tax=Liolophura sinensis TaxID=3198878 RepID=UPI0031591E08